MLIHHAGKDESRGARGWSGLQGALDAEFEVVRSPAGKRALRISKQKDGEDEITMPFELKLVTLGHEEDGGLIQSCVVHHFDHVAPAATGQFSPSERVVLDAFQAAPPEGYLQEDLEEAVQALLPEGSGKGIARRGIKSLLAKRVLREYGDRIQLAAAEDNDSLYSE
jgi:hypothetical protein